MSIGIADIWSVEDASALPPPVVVSASIVDSTTVRVAFDQEMKHVSPSNANDVLNPANYAFTVVGGISRSAVSVALHLANPTQVDISLDGEMTDGAAYTVFVNNVENVRNTVINSVYNFAEFVGFGIYPQVSSAAALSSEAIQVIFSEEMRDNSALVDPNNYVIGGYASIPVDSVTKISSTEVQLNIAPDMKSGGEYDVTVSNVVDLANNPLDPGHAGATFSGVGEHPKLNPNAIPVDAARVKIQFSKDVVGAEALDTENYQIQNGSSSLEILKYWTFDGTGGLKCSTAVEASYDFGSATVTAIMLVELDNNVNRVFIDKLDASGNGYKLFTDSAGELRVTYANNPGATITVITSGNPVPTGEKVLLGWRFDAGVLEAFHVSSAGQKDSGVGSVSGVGNSSKLLFVGIEDDPGLAGLAGKAHYAAFYSGVFLSDTELQGIFDGTYHPAEDFTPFVFVDFHKEVAPTYPPEIAPSNSTNWYFDVIGTPVKTGITQITGDTFEIPTGEQNTGAVYTITVYEPDPPWPKTGIHDFIGNEVKAPDNTATFLGTGVSPPVIEIEPPDNERDIPLRTTLRITVRDDPDEFTGVDETSIWAKLTYTDADGLKHEDYAVKDGNLQPRFAGTKSGAASAPAGIKYTILPRVGRWEEETLYTVYVQASDNESSSNSVQQTFRTGEAVCFEDILPPAAEIETKLSSPLPYTNLEKLRQLLLQFCTTSSVPAVQVRSLLHVASITDLRTILAGVVDFDLVDSIKLCERQPLLLIRRKLQPYWKHVRPAIAEVPNLNPEAKALLERYTGSQSAVYAVNAMAAAVVLAAAQQES